MNIKLADFGLLKDGLDLRIYLKIWLYIAPEVYYNGHYTNIISLWLLAIIIFLYIYGLLSKPFEGKQQQDLEIKGQS